MAIRSDFVNVQVGTVMSTKMPFKFQQTRPRTNISLKLYGNFGESYAPNPTSIDVVGTKVIISFDDLAIHKDMNVDSCQLIVLREIYPTRRANIKAKDGNLIAFKYEIDCTTEYMTGVVRNALRGLINR